MQIEGLNFSNQRPSSQRFEIGSRKCACGEPEMFTRSVCGAVFTSACVCARASACVGARARTCLCAPANGPLRELLRLTYAGACLRMRM
eukprot:858405-Pleurochrysis_carterae.AAC.1